MEDSKAAFEKVFWSPIEQWSVDNVCAFLDSIHLGQHAKTFRSNEINGQLLAELDASAFKELGVSAVDQAKLRVAFRQSKGM